GQFVVLWDNFLDGDQAGVFGQRLSFATPTSTPTPTVTPTPTSTPTPPQLVLERTSLNFGIVKSGATLLYVTPFQNVSITAPGSWTPSSSLPFVGLSPV